VRCVGGCSRVACVYVRGGIDYVAGWLVYTCKVCKGGCNEEMMLWMVVGEGSDSE